MKNQQDTGCLFTGATPQQLAMPVQSGISRFKKVVLTI
jgi:hypothetical protein